LYTTQDADFVTYSNNVIPAYLCYVFCKILIRLIVILAECLFYHLLWDEVDFVRLTVKLFLIRAYQYRRYYDILHITNTREEKRKHFWMCRPDLLKK